MLCSFTHSGDSPWHQLAGAAWPWGRCWSWWRYRGAGGPRCWGCWGPALPDCTETEATVPSPILGAPPPQTKLHYSETKKKKVQMKNMDNMEWESSWYIYIYLLLQLLLVNVKHYNHVHYTQVSINTFHLSLQSLGGIVCGITTLTIFRLQCSSAYYFLLFPLSDLL